MLTASGAAATVVNMSKLRARLFGVLVLLTGFLTAAGIQPAAAAPLPDSLWFDESAAATLTVEDGRFTDGLGREVVLRGYNVSGETKLEENNGLPFASVADAKKSATALRALGGGNTVRFLLSWAQAEPVRGQVDTTYLAAATAQIGAFLDAGIRVYPDFHQDLYSRYLFNSGSWYTGDGAPKWAVEAGNYPQESCGICIFWGQNITQNQAVTKASYDFWHNTYGLQDAFLTTAQATMAYVKQHLTTSQFAGVVGFDPFNEPHAGTYDSGQTSRTWERDVLWPFYVKFRARMDAAGWQAKPAFVEPNLFWNANISSQKQEGGLLDAGTIGPRYVFNTHFYDQKAISGILMWGKAGTASTPPTSGRCATGRRPPARRRSSASSATRWPDRSRTRRPLSSRRCTRPSTPVSRARVGGPIRPPPARSSPPPSGSGTSTTAAITS